MGKPHGQYAPDALSQKEDAGFMMIVVLSDTHMPRVTQNLPPQVVSEIEKADMVMHAGDFVELEVYEHIKKLNHNIRAVYGNMDSQDLRRRLKEKEIVSVGKLKIGLIHGFGAPKDLENTVAGEFTGVNAIVFGHSHAAVNSKKSGVLLFNPGSPTDNIFAKINTYGILEVTDKGIEGKIVRL